MKGRVIFEKNTFPQVVTQINEFSLHQYRNFELIYYFYILSETRMLRNHYISFFLSDQSLLSSPRSVDSWRRMLIGL